MRPTERTPRTMGPPPTYRPEQIAKATIGIVGAIVAVMAAASYPVAAVTVIAAAIVVRHVTREMARYVGTTVEDSDAARYCVPKVGICVTIAATGD